MEQREKIHLKRFAERLKEALKAKTGWGRNELRTLINTILVEYLIDEGDLEMEEAGAVELMYASRAKGEEVVLHRGQENKPTLKDEEPPL